MTIVLRSFRYRLHPTCAQERSLLAWLDGTREVYNAALEERRDAWKKQRISVSLYDQMAQLADVRADRPDIAAVPLVVLRGSLRRLDKAFKAFFRRCKSGEKPGYPRFKSASRWETIEIDDLTGTGLVAGGKRVALPFVGKVKLGREHRRPEGRPKAIRITRNAAGHWTIAFACEGVEAKPLPPSDRAVGVDLGLLHFAATSDGETFRNPRPLAKARIVVERAQRRVSRRKKGSKRRRKAVRLLRRQHERVANLRRENAITVARSLVAIYGLIVVEKLNVQGLARSALARPVHDAGWSIFRHWLDCKVEETGRRVVEVNPAGTSQTCPRCGVVKAKSLSERMHRCSDCGLILDRDVAAAQVILGLGLGQQGAAPSARGQRRSAKPKSTTVRSTPNVVGEF